MLGENFPGTLEAARQGAEWAWTAIYRELAPAVIGYLRARRTPDPEDVAGEVFLQVVRDLHRFRGGEREFRAWVFVIAHHRLLDESRRRARRPVDFEREDSAGAIDANDLETQVIESTAAAGIRRLIDRLPHDQRNVVLLRVLGDLTVDEVALAIGKTAGAVKALQRRGLASIKRALAEEGAPL